MKNLTDFSFTIKNVPESVLNDIWKELSRWGRKQFGDIIEQSNTIVMEFGDLARECPVGLNDVLSSAMALHCVQSASNQTDNN